MDRTPGFQSSEHELVSESMRVLAECVESSLDVGANVVMTRDRSGVDTCISAVDAYPKEVVVSWEDSNHWGRLTVRGAAEAWNTVGHSSRLQREIEMDVPVTEEQIRTLAFYLWEQDGSPEGRSEEYWEKARQQPGADAPSAPSEGDTAS